MSYIWTFFAGTIFGAMIMALIAAGHDDDE
jgi:predicted acylesterase/phospholipase RssA